MHLQSEVVCVNTYLSGPVSAPGCAAKGFPRGREGNSVARGQVEHDVKPRPERSAPPTVTCSGCGGEEGRLKVHHVGE